MVICPHCKPGDKQHGKNFKNPSMLTTHIRYKHPENFKDDKPGKDLPKNLGNDRHDDLDLDFDQGADLTKNDLGLGQEPAATQTFYCSECGQTLKGTEKECPNCQEPFE